MGRGGAAAVTKNFEFPPIFAKQYISPYFGKIIISPLLVEMSPDILKNLRFFTYFTFFRFPLVWPWCIYASHNSFGHFYSAPSSPLLLRGAPHNARTERPCRHTYVFDHSESAPLDGHSEHYERLRDLQRFKRFIYDLQRTIYFRDALTYMEALNR